jgi:dCMP deaminase
MSKRENYINWDEYFMGIALLSAERSKDPNSQVGACIVSDDNKILSIGYNGFPVRMFR